LGLRIGCTRETLSNLQNTVIFPWLFDARRPGSVCFLAVQAFGRPKSLWLSYFLAVASQGDLCICDSRVLFAAALALSSTDSPALRPVS
jgi:hypothetical protein